MLALRSLLFLVVQVVTVVPFAIASLLMLPLPLHWRYAVVICYPRVTIAAARWICGIRWRKQGFEHLPDGPCVLLSKHQSTWETFFYPSVMPRELCYVYKRELHYLPFFGWGIASLRMIHIDRKKGQDAFESVVSQGTLRVAEGRWIIMFPEGTRTPVGSLANYKSGAARLAVRTGAIVVPVAHNSGEHWPRKSFLLRPGTIHVSIGPPIDSRTLTAEQLNLALQTWIETEMRTLSPHAYAAADAAAVLQA